MISHNLYSQTSLNTGTSTLQLQALLDSWRIRFLDGLSSGKDLVFWYHEATFALHHETLAKIISSTQGPDQSQDTALSSARNILRSTIMADKGTSSRYN
jgi:hypothetical protein